MNQPLIPSLIQLEPDLEVALQFKAEQLHLSVSDIVNQAVRLALEEDRADLAAFEERASEPTLSLEELLQDLKAHGKV